MAAAEGEAQTREELQRLLDEERRKNEVYQRALNEMRNQMGVQQSQTEAEAESITNKLIARIQEIEKDKVALRLQVEAEERRMKSEKTELEHKLQQNANHLSRLKHEKEVIVRQVEQEEEFLTNTLQQKLSKVLAEKIEIENNLVGKYYDSPVMFSSTLPMLKESGRVFSKRICIPPPLVDWGWQGLPVLFTNKFKMGERIRSINTFLSNEHW